ncbi:mechanosensitive ion channel family protein [Cognatishimia sp. MH4019]|uniref:mechanosensitive ion channel family protein n=1 Tax=Cognatishimia sp. MH4019 TaxID=2854030 RepID=UPI001CD24A3C|nr:mechanosensitive ion channel family protein [Cognatishimia sp. MH4019]
MRLFLSLVLCLFLPFAAMAQDTTEQPTGTIAVEDSAAQDAAIATRIRSILGELQGFEDVTVSVSNGIVTLRGTTLDAFTANRLNDLAGRVEGVVAIENNVIETTDVVERLNPAVERFQARLTQLIAFIPLALVALLAFLVVVVVGILITRMRQPWDRLAPNKFIANIYRQLVRLAFMIGGLVVALDILNATALLSTILGAAGIVGLAIGFAVRDTVENFIASIMLSIRQPFRPNDTVEIEGDIGKVIRLTSRATILLSFDGNHIHIPNATVFKSRIVNYTRNDERRFLFDLGIAPDADLAQARDIAQETIEALPFVLDKPAPDCWIEAIGDSTITLRVTGWIAQHETSLVAARGEAIRLVMAALTADGIEMPEPTYRLITDMGETAQDTPRIKKSPAKPVIAEPKEVSATADKELSEIIEDERNAQSESDLLDRNAERE